MSVVLKYPIALTYSQLIEMPIGAKILCVQIQRKTPCIWTMIVEDKLSSGRRLMAKRRIYTYGTGCSFDYGDTITYIGTYQMAAGEFIWHVFDGGEMRA